MTAVAPTVRGAEAPDRGRAARLRRRFASQWDPTRARTWAEVSKHGRVRRDDSRGWHIDFRTVLWPGAEKPRRIRVTRTHDYGKFTTKREAERCLRTIQDRSISRPLCDVLADYIDQEIPENTVLHRWEFDFLVSKRLQRRRGELSAAGLRELELMPGRGYLRFWEGRSVPEIQGPSLHRWREWLGENFEHLQPPTLRNIFGSFRTFVGHLHLMGALREIPPFPVIRRADVAKRVPDPVSLGRILAEIPEEIRGLWLARGLAGLRPSEARRLDVSNYENGTLRIRPEQSKTKKARELLISAVVPELDAWIRQYRTNAPPWAPLFINPTSWKEGQRWLQTAERAVWVAALEAAGLEHIAPNRGGRHAFITHEIAAGTDPYAVKDWAGHSSLNTTQGYVSVSSVTLARRMRPRESGPTVDQDQRNTRYAREKVVGDTRFELAPDSKNPRGKRPK